MRKTNPTMQGFSLVELMIGVLIAIIASIIMFQVFAFSERQKRTTTGASDAQINGAIALDTMEREVRMAGFGLTSSVLTDCNPETTYSYKDPGGELPVSTLGAISQPILITQGANGPDTVRILVSAASAAANYTNAGQICLRSTMPQPSSELNVVSTHGCAEGNMAILVQRQSLGSTNAGSCTVMQITHVQDSSLKIQHNPGQGDGPSYNPPASYQNANDWPAYAVSSGGCEAYLVCMGAMADSEGTTFTIDTNTRQLLRNGVAVASGIMDMQAEYGLVDGAAGPLNTWQAATGTWAATASFTQAQVRQIKAIRLALIARSGEYEKPNNANNACDTTATTNGLSSWATFDTTNWPADWQCYRYKVFETIIPLRNVIWSAT